MSLILKSSRVRAPSNIALVKYMGKTSIEGNQPANSSLSLTLSSLCTGIELEAVSRSSSEKETLDFSDFFFAVSEPPRFLAPPGFHWQVPPLSEKGTQRFAKHAERCLKELPDIFERYTLALDETLIQSVLVHKSISLVLRSANTFPAGVGIASSASSFAALTLAMAALLSKDEKKIRLLHENDSAFRRALAGLSQRGSGSSCRSFEGPFVKWSSVLLADTNEHTTTVPTKCTSFTDFVLVISSEEKTVGSSEAHTRVQSSPQWLGRPKRADMRLARVESALADGNLEVLSREVWEESEDMHGLFHTAQPPFTYRSLDTHEILKKLRTHPRFSQSLITLDAGPNVHVIVPTSEASEWRVYFEKTFPKLRMLEDIQGMGAVIL